MVIFFSFVVRALMNCLLEKRRKSLLGNFNAGVLEFQYFENSLMANMYNVYQNLKKVLRI